MKLLKYVMTSDKGLAPNPYFGVCSLALCTPNHMNARLVSATGSLAIRAEPRETS